MFYHKIIRKICVFGGIFFGANAIAQTSDLEKYDLKGKVKSVRIKSKFDYVGDCADLMMAKKIGDPSCLSKFDEKGNLIKNSWYNYSSLFQEHFYFTEDGKKKIKINFYWNNKIDQTEIIDDTEEAVNSLQKKRTVRTFDGYKSHYLWEYDNKERKYDQHGNWIEKTFSEPGHIEKRPNGEIELLRCSSLRQVVREIEYYN